MSAGRRKVLQMLHDHQVTVPEAEELLDAMAATDRAPSAPKPELVGDSEWNWALLMSFSYRLR